MKALKNTTYQLTEKKITKFKSNDDLMFEIDPNESTFFWEQDGEVQITLKKRDPKVWNNLF